MKLRRQSLLWPAAALAVSCLVGTILVWHSRSLYMIYPDSYTNLLVAANLAHHGRLVAPLGPGGLVYPDFVAWTRPLYPALVALLMMLRVPAVAAARAITATAAVMAIPASYYWTRRLLASTAAGLAAAGLIAVSYAHTVWSGFILTEPLAGLVLTLALWRWWQARQLEADWFDPSDIATGLVLALAILVRYEYAVVLIPVVLFLGRPWQLRRALSLLFWAIVPTVLVVSLLKPFSAGPAWWWPQLSSLVWFAVIGVLVALTVGVATSRRRLPVPETIYRLGVGALWLAVLALVLHHQFYIGLWWFATHDWLICTLALVGYSLLWLRPATRTIAGFGLTTAVLLAGIYHHTNPTMERYLAHLLPLLVPAAAYAAWRGLAGRYRYAVAAGLMLAAGLQAGQSYHGLRASGTDWFSPGYEQLGAQAVGRLAGPGDLIVAALPEPYRLYGPAAVQGLATTPPYLDLSASSQNRTVYVVDDAALDRLFPQFANLLAARLTARPVAIFPVAAPFRYATSRDDHPKAVMVYRLKAGQLQCLVETTNRGGCP